MKKNIDISRDKIADFCRRHYIRKLSFFGSVLSDDFRQDSDIDVIVEFKPGHAPGLGLIRMQEEFSALSGDTRLTCLRPGS